MLNTISVPTPVITTHSASSNPFQEVTEVFPVSRVRNDTFEQQNGCPVFTDEHRLILKGHWPKE